MSSPRRRARALGLLMALAVVALPACADDPPGTSITVEAGPDSCSISRDTAEGPVGFWVINVGEGDMAVSLYDSDGQLVVEVEDVGPQMWHAMSANVYDGEFELECRPAQGQTTRTSLTVG